MFLRRSALPHPAIYTSERQHDYRRDLLQKFEDNDEVEFVAVHDRYTRRDMYYSTMMKNVLAEAVAAFHSGGKVTLQGRYSSSGLIVKSPPSFETSAPAARGVASSAPAAELQLKDNVVSVRDRSGLFWVSGCEVREAGTEKDAVITGWSLEDGKLEEIRLSEMTIYVHLFAGDYANRYRCAAELLHGSAGNRELELAVLDPSSRGPGSYTGSVCFRSDLMPINQEQRNAVAGLHRRVEVIHGPPGTGKSTTIFHVTSARQPASSLSIVTCVTNQAIDAVAEKLATVHGIEGGQRLLVLGNPGRVGSTAAQYTLDILSTRDELVVGMKAFVNVLTQVDKGLKALQNERAGRMWKQHGSSRLSRTAIMSLGAVQKRISEIDKKYQEDRDRILSDRLTFSSMRSMRQQEELRELEAEYQASRDPKKIHIENLNMIKEKMVRAFVNARPIDAGTTRDVIARCRQERARGAARHLVGFGLSRRIQQSRRLPAWHIGAFHKKVQDALNLARNGLQVAVRTAKARTVRQTRVLLCTIPSSYKVMQLKEEYPRDFPGRLFLAILDEAAATAETYVPLVLRLGVENLVMLGDHKQLSPLVLATGGDREHQDKRLDRSLMERVLDCGVQPHPLREQYRMPQVLCDLVSNLFYQGQLRMGSSISNELGRLSLQTGSSILRWYDVDDSEESVGTSKVNCSEVVQVTKLLATDPVLANTREKIFIITLYKPQATLLQHALMTYHRQKMVTGKVEVLTVDAAQGSEAPHILLSTVRSNSAHNIGFAANPRRLCVAISRAQKTLTVVGNASTLSVNPDWRQVVEAFRRKGSVETINGYSLRVSDYWHEVQSKCGDMASRQNRGGKGGSKGHGKGGSKGHGKGSFGGISSFNGRGKGSFGGTSGGRRPTQICRYYLQGRCTRGRLCTFRHGL